MQYGTVYRWWLVSVGKLTSKVLLVQTMVSNTVLNHKLPFMQAQVSTSHTELKLNAMFTIDMWL